MRTEITGCELCGGRTAIEDEYTGDTRCATCGVPVIPRKPDAAPEQGIGAGWAIIWLLGMCAVVAVAVAALVLFADATK